MVRKESRKLERVFKGIANHRRIDIVFLVKLHPKITLFEIADRLQCNRKTICEHTRKLVIAGLVNKKHQGRQVTHQLSPYGEKIYKILNSF